jgi:hypothetical protein
MTAEDLRGFSMYCPHGMAAYVVCPKCVEQARQERREDRQVQAFDRLSETMAALHAFLRELS